MRGASRKKWDVQCGIPQYTRRGAGSHISYPESRIESRTSDRPCRIKPTREPCPSILFHHCAKKPMSASDAPCHFDRREKSFIDPAHAKGAFVFLFQARFKYLWRRIYA